MHRDHPSTAGQATPRTAAQRLRRRLQELIAAIDRRVPHPARHGEAQIAAEAATLRREAATRLAVLDRDPQ